MITQDSIALRQKLESLVVEELQGRLEKNEITGDRAKEIAQIFLETVPEDVSHEQLIAIIAELDDKAGELAGIVYKILSENDEVVKRQEMDKVRSLLTSIKK